MEKIQEKINTFLYNPDVTLIKVKAKKKLKLTYPVYNFEVEDNNNYFANGLLVHNCKAIIKIMEHDKPDDFVVSTEEYHSVKEFLVEVFDYLKLDWEKYVKYDKVFTRPNEVPALLGDSSKIRETLGWQPEFDFKGLIKDMVDNDLKLEA